MSKYTKLFEQMLKVTSEAASKIELNESGDFSEEDRERVAEAGAKIFHKIVVEMSRDLLDEFEDDIPGDDGLLDDLNDDSITDAIEDDMTEIDSEHAYGNGDIDVDIDLEDDPLGESEDCDDEDKKLDENDEGSLSGLTDEDFAELRAELEAAANETDAIEDEDFGDLDDLDDLDDENSDDLDDDFDDEDLDDEDSEDDEDLGDGDEEDDFGDDEDSDDLGDDFDDEDLDDEGEEEEVDVDIDVEDEDEEE